MLFIILIKNASKVKIGKVNIYKADLKKFFSPKNLLGVYCKDFFKIKKKHLEGVYCQIYFKNKHLQGLWCKDLF